MLKALPGLHKALVKLRKPSRLDVLSQIQIFADLDVWGWAADALMWPDGLVVGVCSQLGYTSKSSNRRSANEMLAAGPHFSSLVGVDFLEASRNL